MKKMIFLVMLLLTGCMQPVGAVVVATPTGEARAFETARQVPAPTEASVLASGTLGAGTAPLRCYRVIADESLHIRADHDYQSAVVGYLSRGDVVRVSDIGVDGWLPIEGAVPGWVRALFVESTPCK